MGHDAWRSQAVAACNAEMRPAQIGLSCMAVQSALKAALLRRRPFTCFFSSLGIPEGHHGRYPACVRVCVCVCTRVCFTKRFHLRYFSCLRFFLCRESPVCVCVVRCATDARRVNTSKRANRICSSAHVSRCVQRCSLHLESAHVFLAARQPESGKGR